MSHFFVNLNQLRRNARIKLKYPQLGYKAKRLPLIGLACCGAASQSGLRSLTEEPGIGFPVS